MSRRSAAILRTAALFTAALGQIMGQSSFATITGNVTDPTGAATPGVAIEAIHTATNYRYSAQSNDSGQYTLANLLDGVYTLRATAAGFREFKAGRIILAAREQRRIDVALELGSVDTVVEVSGGATLIETENARISDVKNRDVLLGLPLTLRRVWDYFQMSPTISKTRTGFNIRFGGSRSRQGDMSYDGVSVRSTFGGPVAGVFTEKTEGYQEMRADVAGNSAEYAGIGQVSIVTRSGTNEFHGSAFDYYTTPAFIARDPFALSRTGDVQHILAVAAGGPVLIPELYKGRNRTFFFATFEANAGSNRRNTLNPTVPLPAWRSGDFSALAPATVVKDPYANGAPFAGNRIPASRINPVAGKLQDRFYPLPNYGNPNVFASQNYREIRPTGRPLNPTITVRMDHRFSDKAFIYGRFTKIDWRIETWGNPSTLGLRTNVRRDRSLAMAYTHTLRPNLLSESRWGYASDNLPGDGPIKGNDLVKELGLVGLAGNRPDVGGVFNLAFTGLGITGLSGGSVCDPCANNLVHSFQEVVSWFRGRHSVRAGFSVFRGAYEDYREGEGLFGKHNYSNRFTGYPYADFLLGIPTTASRAFPALKQDTHAWTYTGFVTDEFKLHRALTLSLGLRYEYKAGFTSDNGLQSMFDIGTGKIVVPDGMLGKVSPLMPRGYVDVVEAKDLGLPGQALIRSDRNNFAPRIGIAWRPWGNNTVFRAGYGIFYDLAARNPALSSVPFNISEPAFTNPAGTPTIALPVVFPQSVAGPATVTIPGAINPDIRIPYSMQYTFTIEHQRWDTGFRASYIGTNTRQGVWGYDINQPVADSRPYVAKPRMFPRYPGINYSTNGAGHQYNSLTLQAERRWESGFRFQSYYTLGRDIGDLEDGQAPEDAYNRRRERAVWEDIPTHRFTTNFLYELPVGKGKPLASGSGRVLNGVIGGWQLGGIYIRQTGYFLTPAWTGPDPTGTRFTSSSTPANVTIRPNILKDANLANPTPARWFDASAFAAPTAGYFGTSAKGVIKGPGTNVMHATISKQFKIRERARLKLEFLGNNVFNHPNYFEPNTNITAVGQTGVISAVVNRNQKLDSAVVRTLQFMVRLEW